MDIDTVLIGMAACIGGVTAGLAYFHALKRSTALFVQEDGWRQALLLTLARLAGAVAVFLLLAQAGALPLVAAFVGFLIARALAMSLTRERA